MKVEADHNEEPLNTQETAIAARRLSRWLAIAGRVLWLELISGFALLSAYVFIQRLGGDNPGADFIIYYAASLLTLGGDPGAIFSWPALQEAQAGVIGKTIDYLPWLYPPPLLLLAAPLSALPYIPALGFWIAAQLAMLAAAVRTLGGTGWTILAAFVFPATINNILVGQNGALSAALLGGGLALLNRHPAIAGVLFGLLIYKPHLAILLPFALLAASAWRALAAALASALGASLLSMAVFGMEPWSAFLASTSAGTKALEYGSAHWPKMATVFAALRLLGAEVSLAYAGQGIAALFAVVAVVLIWRRRQARSWRAPALIIATFLATPYAFFYDLVVLIFAILWLQRPGLSQGGRMILALLWLAPVALWLLARYSQISLWPLLLAGCLAWIYSQARKAE
ncbi:MAG: glycosyltransferase 87 family protein [Alphaproteobacteria bacterium]|nr:glycosyltransferase 87 family protein [Alphaproteobacteria bacterium]